MFVSFCCTTVWISSMNTHIPSLLFFVFLNQTFIFLNSPEIHILSSLLTHSMYILWSFLPGGSDSKKYAHDARDSSLIPGLGRSLSRKWQLKIPLSRKWQPTLVFLPGEFRGQRRLVSYSPWGCRVGHSWATNIFTSFIDSSVYPVKYLLSTC